MTEMKTDNKWRDILVSMPDPRYINIIPRNKDGTSWAVKRDCTRRAKYVCSSMQEAINIARNYKIKNKK